MYQTTDRRNGGPRLMEPTPQFISNKQVSISESNSINLNMVMVHNNQTTISSQSMNIGDFSPNDQAINTSQVKRSPNISNHRSKPQSPKILLP
jgi:K+ transporter